EKMLKYLSVFGLLLAAFFSASGIEKTTVDKTLESVLIGKRSYVYEDGTGALTLEQVMESGDFKALDKDIATLQDPKASYWLRFTVSNTNLTSRLFIEFVQPF